jgi:small GTP-binding protein
MDLKDYERVKFELAEVLRSVDPIVKDQAREAQDRLRELFVRLAEDRFNLVVVGRFSRGKTSLMNAILGTDRLPTGIVPLTSVVTTVAYGSREQVIINYHDKRIPSEIPIDALPQFITQGHNPGNIRQVRVAGVKLPAEFLRRGFHFVDTPGLGSAIPENTRTTENFLPEADAFVLVTSYDSPLSEEELRIVRVASASGRRVFVVLNKHDLVTCDERRDAADYLNKQLLEVLGNSVPQVFSVSAREGIEARRSRDAQRLAASGIEELETELVRFLLAYKSAEFLLRMCDRVADLLHQLSHKVDVKRSLERIHSLSKRVVVDTPGTGTRNEAPMAGSIVSGAVPQIAPCEICEQIVSASFEFLCRFQYDLSVDPEVQQDHARRGGLCPLHSWQYGSLASTQGICTGYPALLERLSAWFRGAGVSGRPSGSLSASIAALQPTEDSCVMCQLRANTEAKAVSSIVDRLKREREGTLNSLSAICLPHFRVLVAAVDDDAVIQGLLVREATTLDRIAEDMRRYATKHDAIRRGLASEEETKAAYTALRVVAGLRNVHLAGSTN